MELIQNKSLKELNTFGIDAKAKYFFSPRNVAEVQKIKELPVFDEKLFLVLGGGSNILFTKDFKGLVIQLNIKGIRILESQEEYVIVSVGAGENWSRFVEICLKNNWYGLENLALIPGTVGAAPVQNIGAYGAEQSTFFHSLLGFDLKNNQIIELTNSDCRFSYRNSIFKQEFLDSFIVTEVRYKLSKHEILNINYIDIKREIAKFAIQNPDSRYIFDTVVRLRRKKLADTEILGNAGSFFKNPLIDKGEFEKKRYLLANVPFYDAPNNRVKLSAAWLIDSLGWKGKRFGDAGVYEKHALILVNYGAAKGEEILELANDISTSVYDSYGINLEREVRVI